MATTRMTKAGFLNNFTYSERIELIGFLSIGYVEALTISLALHVAILLPIAAFNIRRIPMDSLSIRR